MDLSSFSKDDFVEHSVHGSVYHEGVKFSALVIPSSIEAMKNFEVRDDDVWINTYSKSGTHWASEIVHLIFNDGNPATIDRTTTQGNIEMIYFAKDTYDEGKTRHLPFYKILERAPSPRIIQSHLPVRFLPPQIATKAKVIYVARNPKDLITSLDKFVGGNEMGDFIRWQSALKEFMDGTRNYGSWFDHVKTSWNLRHEDNRLFLKYESMKKDLRAEVIRVAEFLGRPLSEETLQKVVEHATFDGMKKTYDKVEKQENGELLVKAVGTYAYMNKGVIAAWKSRFTVSESEEFDRVYAEKMADTDLTFQFE